MRLKKVKGARDKIENSNYSVNLDNINNNESLFDNSNPIHVEIGTGKGRYIYTLAKQNPNINYVGIEMFDSVIVRAIEKVEEDNINNIKFIRCDAFLLGEKFENYFDQIYLNFSDPWPKTRHTKRRLTSPRFLNLYRKLLKKNCFLTFKTDNTKLFEYSVLTMNNFGCSINKFSIDLHNSEYNKDNIRTEYEDKFSKLGEKIKLIEISF